MVSINLRELLDILDCDSKFDCWLYKDCEIDDNGIRLRPFDEHTLSLLEGDETRVLDEYKKDIKLNFPCTLDEVKAWAERNGFDDLLDESELFKEWQDAAAETHKSGTETVGDAGEGNQATKQRKKLKPLERETNEGLLLLYEIFKLYEVEYLDELPAIKAWGKIISKEFTSDLIKEISDAKKSITLSGGEKLGKIDFIDKYRKRFK